MATAPPLTTTYATCRPSLEKAKHSPAKLWRIAGSLSDASTHVLMGAPPIDATNFPSGLNEICRSGAPRSAKSATSAAFGNKGTAAAGGGTAGGGIGAGAVGPGAVATGTAAGATGAGWLLAGGKVLG